MNGREKCELLNNIRKRIAEKNDIDFVIYDCTFEGDCTGTCPKCESEIKYLEDELIRKQESGEKININGIFSAEEYKPKCSDMAGEEVHMDCSEIVEGDLDSPQLPLEEVVDINTKGMLEPPYPDIRPVTLGNLDIYRPKRSSEKISEHREHTFKKILR